MKKTSFVHVFNPVVKPQGHELKRAQALVLSSMAVARDWARGKVEVEHWAACFPEDLSLVPPWFERTDVLSRSIRDECGGDGVPKLPVLADIIGPAARESEADYVVYSNADITLMPFFYESVHELLGRGYDSMLINRRTVPERYEHSLPLLFAEIGAPHPGYDCFVFPRCWFADMCFGDAVLGASGTDWLFAVNLWVLSKQNLTAKDLHLTFHLGDERAWRQTLQSDWWRTASERTSRALGELRMRHGEHHWFLWPRPTPPRQTLFQRGMNRIARELGVRFPDQR